MKIRKNSFTNIVRDEATSMYTERMRTLFKRDERLYNGIFAYGIIRVFGIKYKLPPLGIVLLMLYDVFKVLTIKEAIIWQVAYSSKELWNLRLRLSKEGYIIGTNGKYYLSIKGKALIKDYNEYYDEYTKQALKLVGKG